MDNKQKCLCLIAILLALLAYSTASSVSESTINQTLGLHMVLNTTNLAPTIEPSEPGTGERVDNITYWTNNSDIEIHAWAHAMNVSQTAGAFLYINNTLYSPRAGRPLGGAEIAYRGVDVVIPKGSYYRIDFENYHHYVWRETQIFSGNFTSNITDNDSAYVLKSGDTMTGQLNISFINSTNDLTLSNKAPGHDISKLVINNGIGFYSDVTQKFLLSIPLNTFYFFMPVEIRGNLNMFNNSITNCANCDSYSKLVNRSYNSTGAVSTGTNTIPHDDTIPTSTEGFAVLNITYTPKNTNNYLKICSQVMLSTSQTAANLLGNFVLYNNTTIGISNTYSPAQFFEVNTGVCAFTQAGTTSPVLIQSRAGSNAAGTVTINGAAGSRNYGGAYNTYLVVDEYVP